MKIKNYAIILFSLICSLNIKLSLSAVSSEEQEYKLLLDRKLSPYVGTEIVKSLATGYTALLPYKDIDIGLKPVAVRYLRLLLLDTLAYSQGLLINHEVFGHGYRLREFNIPGIGYNWGFFSASTTYNTIKKITFVNGNLVIEKNLNAQQQIAVTLGGMDASDVLMREMYSKILRQKHLTVQDAWLSFFTGAFDQINYIHFNDNFRPGHDVRAYVDELNGIYGRGTLTLSNLRTLAFLNYFDPFLYYSLYTIFGNYGVHGETRWRYPMIAVGNLEYLPALRMVLTPYGPEGQFANYLRFKQFTAQLLFNYGSTSNHQSYGLGLLVGTIPVNEYIGLGGKFHIWRQPELQLGTGNPVTSPDQWGALATLKGEIRTYRNFYIFSEIGYKTKGFIQGEMLAASAVVRLGGGIRI